VLLILRILELKNKVTITTQLKIDLKFSQALAFSDSCCAFL